VKNRFLCKTCFLVFLWLISTAVIAKKEMEPLFISPAEVKAGKVVAQANCAQCHGVDGSLIKDGQPNLAGQHADYLFSQLVAFQSGHRIASNGEHRMKSLKESALKNVAIYYSMLDLDNPSKKKKARKKNKMSPMEAGKKVAKKCQQCHGKTGNGTFSGMPRLTGKHQRYLVSALKAYKSGTRSDLMMEKAVVDLSENDIENLALYYASQKPISSNTNAIGDESKGREQSSSCGGCHGEVGHSVTVEVPSLAGQDPAYLIKAVNAYKKGLRKHSKMRSAVETLTEKNIANIAAFYAKQTPKIPEIVQPQSVEIIAEKCDRCHGVNGNSRDRVVPSIASQSEAYLVNAMVMYKEGQRGNSMMQLMLKPLRVVDINALATHYASKNRRSVIFVNDRR